MIARQIWDLAYDCCCFPIPAVLALGVFDCSRECAVCFVASLVVVFCLDAFSLSWHFLCLELWLNNINHFKKKKSTAIVESISSIQKFIVKKQI
jgi:hypothetical protein